MSEVIQLCPGNRMNLPVVKEKLLEFFEQLRKQVSTNQFETVTKFNFNHTTLGYELTARPAYKFLGPNQICAWKTKPYTQRPDMKLGSFKIKLFGEPVGHIVFDVGHILGTKSFNTESKELLDLVNGIVTLANRRIQESQLV
jgi:hypothetical protein